VHFYNTVASNLL